MSCQLHIQKVCKVFQNGYRALNNLSLDIEQGKLVSIVGPSGCGKSTLLNLIAGLDQPTSGQLQLGDKNPGVLDLGEVGMVFQAPTLLPWLTVEKNIQISQSLTGKVDDNKIQYLLEMTKLKQFSGQYPDQLSGGQQMRVALARAYATDPTLLLLDEPFSALDEITRFNMAENLNKYHQQVDCTTLLVTHNIQEAVFLSDRVIVMGFEDSGVIGEIAIDLPGERSMSLMRTSEFHKLLAQVSELLYQTHENH